MPQSTLCTPWASHHGLLGQVGCYHYLVTYLSTRRRKKSRSSSQGTFEDRHAKEEALYQPPSSRSELSRRRPGVSARHFSQRNQAFPCQREAHTKIYRPPPGSLQDEEKTVTNWSFHLSAQRFPTRHNFGNVSNFLTSPTTTRTSITKPSTPSAS